MLSALVAGTGLDGAPPAPPAPPVPTVPIPTVEPDPMALVVPPGMSLPGMKMLPPNLTGLMGGGMSGMTRKELETIQIKRDKERDLANMTWKERQNLGSDLANRRSRSRRRSRRRSRSRRRR